MNKGIWMGKATDGDLTFDSSRIESKRSHQWFVDTAQPELFPNKKQALETPNRVSNSGISTENFAAWNNPSSFQSVPNQFIHHLFGPETVDTANYTERPTCPETGDSNASVSLSISHVLEDPEACLSYGAFKKVKINEVKDADNSFHDQREHNFIKESSSEIPSGQAYSREHENFISISQAYDKEDDNVALLGHSYNRDAHIVSTYIKEDDHAIPINETCSKEETHMITFGVFHDAPNMIPVSRPDSCYDQSYNQSSFQTPEAIHEKELGESNTNAVAGINEVAKLKPESVSRNKPEVKTSRKEAPNSFPSNVRSLISTGMLDGVPVKYVSMAREELRGIIKGSGYLCSCHACNYSKVLNAYEFERHAGCKTKHPNNHIYFENGKTIYQIVQELRSTPESTLFDVIQTVFGAPINQKSFRVWKESFQAATRELQRIYGKEELNL